MNPTSEPTHQRLPVLLIGWDAADWRVIDPLMREGYLPNLQHLIARGVRACTRTLYPALSPTLWTSIATGKRPYKHGIHGFTEPCPDSGAIRPITTLNRKSKALWNIFTQQNMKSNVVAWWPSHPAERISGCMVSNHFYQIKSADPKTSWPLAESIISPKRLEKKLADLRVHPATLTAEHVLPFVPNLLDMKVKTNSRIQTLARLIAECSSVHNAATALLEEEPAAFTAVYYDAIDHFSHAFMKYHPPRKKDVSEEDFHNYKNVVAGCYHLHDMFLGRLLELAGEDCRILLLSDHGFHSDHLRPDDLPSEPTGPATEHRELGVFVAAGPGIKSGGIEVPALSLLDVAPTILTLYGLPVGEDMDGVVAKEIFANKPQIESIPSWDSIPGCDGSHPKESHLSPEEAEATLQQLVELGYIDQPGANADQNRRNTQRELDYNRARAHMDGRQYVRAAQILERLWEEFPDQHRFGLQLFTCREILNQPEAAESTLKLLLKRKTEQTVTARKKITELTERIETKNKNGDEITPRERQELHALKKQANFNPRTTAILQCRLVLLRGGQNEALQIIEKSVRQWPDDIPLLLTRGHIASQAKNWEQAKDSFSRVLEVDPDQARAHHGLAQVYLLQKREFDSLTHSIKAIRLDNQNPWFHHTYGNALKLARKPIWALRQWERAVQIHPGFVEAWEAIIALLERQHPAKQSPATLAMAQVGLKKARSTTQSHMPDTNDSNIADQISSLNTKLDNLLAQINHSKRTLAWEKQHSPITIVTGMPRSGTSLLMQMLEAGGLRPLTDCERQPDTSNERGYFEFEPVKKVKDYHRWIAQARDRSLKVVAPLLHALPDGERYQFIFCLRDTDEVITSQYTMLKLHGPQDSPAYKQLKVSYLKTVVRTLERFQKKNLRFIVMPYSDIIANPSEQSARLQSFFRPMIGLDLGTTAAVVDPGLYRTRTSNLVSK